MKMLKSGHRYWQLTYEGQKPITCIIFYLNIYPGNLLLTIHTYSGVWAYDAEFGVDVVNLFEIEEAKIIKPIKFNDLELAIRKWVKKNSFVKDFNTLLGEDN